LGATLVSEDADAGLPAPDAGVVATALAVAVSGELGAGVAPPHATMGKNSETKIPV